MNDSLQDLMRAATRLTQAGQLQQATAVIHRALGRPLPASAHAGVGACCVAEAQVLDGCVFEPEPGPAPAPSAPGAGVFKSGSHSQARLTRAYKLYVPPGATGRALPLVVMLHGCTQDPDDFAAGTAMNERAREQGFYADAALSLARAEQTQRATRERLTRLLGVWGPQTAFKLPPRMPDLPKEARDLPDIERLALAQRLDVQGARLAAQQTARNLGLTRSTRFVNVLELGVVRNSSNEAPTQRGWEVGLELPLFDWSGARVARAEAVYMQTLHQAAETAINARSEVREAYGAYRSAYDIARHHRDEIVPLRKQISEENVLRYNGMLIGVFDLLADARSQIASVNASIEALRDFWLAQADLDMALIGKPSLAAASGPAMAAETGAAGH